jgi:hypothetical protein
MKLMKEHGTWYVPTIIAGKFVESKANIPGYYPAQIAAKAKLVGPIIQATAGKAYKAGVKIAFDDVAVKPGIGERIRFVRAEIFDGVKISVDVKKCDFFAVL